MSGGGNQGATSAAVRLWPRDRREEAQAHEIALGSIAEIQACKELSRLPEFAFEAHDATAAFIELDAYEDDELDGGSVITRLAQRRGRE